MMDFLFRLKVSFALLWINGCAYADPKVRRFAWGWLRNGMRDLWTKNLSDYYCCSGFDSYGMVGCGCYGMTWREYWNAHLEYRLSWR